MSTRVLLAWELGQNLGHLARLLAVARVLHQAGAELIWALPEHALQSSSLAQAPGHKTRAPSSGFHLQKSLAPSVHSYADILALAGFTQADVIQRGVQAWHALFAQHRVNKVVLDYAPTAQCAAYLAGLPAAQITNGFDAPPAHCPVFGVTQRGPMLDQRNAAQVAVVNQALLKTGLPSTLLATPLHALLNHPTRWYDCLSVTDPYGPRSDGTYIGPQSGLSDCVRMAWPEGEPASKKVLVYLRREPVLLEVLQALSALNARVIAYWPAATPQALTSLEQAGRSISPQALDMQVMLPECDAVVNHGSAGLASQTLLAGKPQLMLPSDVEKHLIAQRVVCCGGGTLLKIGARSVQIQPALEQLLSAQAPLLPPGEFPMKDLLQQLVGRFLRG